MAKPDPNIVSLLYMALESRIGIAVAVGNIQTGKQKLYATRRMLADPALDVLQFRISSDRPESEIWIVKGAPRE